MKDPKITQLEVIHYILMQHQDLIPHVTNMLRMINPNSKDNDISIPIIGSTEWLVAAESHFGGFVTNVERRVVSPHDPRSKKEIGTGGMTGGDRMQRHAYAKYYSKHLARFIENRNDQFLIIEVGILKGSGLALWSKLFPNADIIGLDIDLSHCRNNLDYLAACGAFANKMPELYEYDQFIENKKYINSILDGRKINIFIDDGFHSDESILNTVGDMRDHLSSDFVYFVEDNNSAYAKLKNEFSDKNVYSYGELTVVDAIDIEKYPLF